MNISLRQLAVFEATARLSRITLAANALAMTQSAASQSLKELESSLGYALFNRIGRELVINDEGLAILPKAIQILGMVDDIAMPLSDEISGRLHVAASVTIGSYLMPQILADFITLHPNVEPELQIGNTLNVIETIEKGQAHIGLIEGPAPHTQLPVFPWITDHLDVFCHIEHPLASAEKLTIKQIEQQRWVLREPGSGTRGVFVSALQAQGITLTNTLNLTRQEAIKQAIRAGLGLGCLSQMSVAEEIKNKVFVRLETPLNLSRQLSLVKSPLYEQHSLTQAFWDFLLKQKKGNKNI